jgi:hypothetical protein
MSKAWRSQKLAALIKERGMLHDSIAGGSAIVMLVRQKARSVITRGVLEVRR